MSEDLKKMFGNVCTFRFIFSPSAHRSSRWSKAVEQLVDSDRRELDHMELQRSRNRHESP